MRNKLFAVAALATLTSALFATFASAADHRDSPINVSNPTADINDVWAFRSPTDPDNLVIAISVNPLIAPSDNQTRGVFDRLASYQTPCRRRRRPPGRRDGQHPQGRQLARV